MKQIIKTDYLGKVYQVNKFIEEINKAAKIIRKFKRKNPFDAIAFTGTSGAAFAYPLSYKLGIPLICIRKSVTDNHFRRKVEGQVNTKRYIIVDDFIESGKTIRRIQKEIKNNWAAKPPQLIGIYLYAQSYPYYELVPLIK